MPGRLKFGSLNNFDLTICTEEPVGSSRSTSSSSHLVILTDPPRPNEVVEMSQPSHVISDWVPRRRRPPADPRRCRQHRRNAPMPHSTSLNASPGRDGRSKDEWQTQHIHPVGRARHSGTRKDARPSPSSKRQRRRLWHIV